MSTTPFHIRSADARRLVAEILNLGGQYVSKIGDQPSVYGPIVFHAMVLNGVGLIIGELGDKVGLYEFHGPDCSPVEHDINRVRQIAVLGADRQIHVEPTERLYSRSPGWIAARARCRVCGYVWAAVYPADIEDEDSLECPSCGVDSGEALSHIGPDGQERDR